MHKESYAPEGEYWQLKIAACQNLKQFYSLWLEFKPWIKKYALFYLETEIIPYFHQKKRELEVMSSYTKYKK
ncbi:MAG: hypothetical protein U0X91_20610 [Spirosomataceae bacterium]